MTYVLGIDPSLTATDIGDLDPTVPLWPILDLTGVETLHWPGRAELIHVRSLRAPLAVRLARDVVKRPDGCWFWIGPVDEDGYGRIKVHQRDVRLTRLVWQIRHRQPLPRDEVSRHICDRPACVRPEHLVRRYAAALRPESSASVSPESSG